MTVCANCYGGRAASPTTAASPHDALAKLLDILDAEPKPFAAFRMKWVRELEAHMKTCRAALRASGATEGQPSTGMGEGA